MFKREFAEEELFTFMQNSISNKKVCEGMQSLDKAVDYLNSAMQIFEDMGYHKKANEVLKILVKIAEKHQNKATKDNSTKGLTPEKMVKNLLHHGTQFNMADDGSMSDLLDADIDENLEVTESDFQSSFEDEK